MKIFLSVIVILLGVNLLVDVLDSNMVDIIEERNQTIQRLIKTPNLGSFFMSMWGSFVLDSLLQLLTLFGIKLLQKVLKNQLKIPL